VEEQLRKEERERDRRRQGGRILEEEKRIGRRRENPHVLVIPVEQRRNGWDRDRRDNYDSQTSSSDSDSPARWMGSTTAGKMEAEADELAEMLSQVFPQNPEMAEIAWDSDQSQQPRKEDPLIVANPSATMTPSDNDEGRALPPLYLDQTAQMLLSQGQQQMGAPWDILDETMLRAILAQPMEGTLGARCCRHLDHWKETCGGHEMMQIGM
jgi:hypothetical protein